MTAIVLYEVLHCLVAVCAAVWLFFRAVHGAERSALYVLAGAAACLFLGDVYWLAHLIIRGEPPTIFSACDVAYIGFLLMFNAALPRVEPRHSLRRPFTLCMAAFALFNAAAWMVWTGVWLNNLLWGIPMLVLALHSAMLADQRLSSARCGVFFASLVLLVICEASVLAGGVRSVAGPLCTVLWVLAFGQLAFLLKGTGSLKRLPVPAWALLTFFCECASFLAQGAVYYGFQVVTMTCFVCAAMSAVREGEARHAV